MPNDTTPFPAGTNPVAVSLNITLSQDFSIPDGLDALDKVGKALAKFAGEALCAGTLTPSHPITQGVLTAAAHLEQSVAQGKQALLDRSGLLVPGSQPGGPRRMH